VPARIKTSCGLLRKSDELYFILIFREIDKPADCEAVAGSDGESRTDDRRSAGERIISPQGRLLLLKLKKK